MPNPTNDYTDSVPAVTYSVTIANTSVKTNNIDTSLFQHHLLAKTHRYPQVHIAQNNYVITSVLLVLFTSFVWLYVFNFKTLNQILKNFFRFKSSQESREGISMGNRATVFLILFFIITLSVLIEKILTYYNIKLFSVYVPDEIMIGGILVVTYAVKFTVIKLVGIIFKLQNEANDYIALITNYCNSLGLFMLPVIMLLSFLKQISPIIFIYIGVALIVFSWLIRTANGIVLGLSSSKISKFYLFIYLCALEIIPFILITKLIILRIR